MTVPVAKLQALRVRLGLDSPPPAAVPFLAGAQVRVERRIVVKGPFDAITVYRENELQRAYELAASPPGPFPPPLRPDLDQRYGVMPPW